MAAYNVQPARLTPDDAVIVACTAQRFQASRYAALPITVRAAVEGGRRRLIEGAGLRLINPGPRHFVGRAQGASIRRLGLDEDGPT